ncbi:MAG: substrate-binding domain-containing protein [Magnetococcales bacterium]|nr:substrate-binding domain-containing protein [Magnetococcales bacterium]
MLTYPLGIITFIFTLLSTMLVNADNTIPPEARFSDPTKIIPMPQRWIDQPLRYPAWSKGADLTVSLDQQIYRTFADLIPEFEKESGLTVAFREGTCGISAGLLFKKQVDSAGFCCPAGEVDRLPGLTYHTFAIGALAIFVHNKNPIEGMSLQQLRKVYSGEVTQWSQVTSDTGIKGQSDMGVQPVGRLHCKIRPGHWRLILDNPGKFSARLQEVGTIPDMIAQVSKNPRAIGYETMLHLMRFKNKGQPKVIRINNADPRDQHAVASGQYPLYRTFSVSTWDQHSPEKQQNMKKLIEFLTTRTKSLPAKYGLVPLDALKKNGWRFHGTELIGEP